MPPIAFDANTIQERLPQQLMGELIIESHCVQDTVRAAQAVAATLAMGDVALLNGELGAGKTVFVSAVAHALGVTAPVTSPTFTLQKIYELPGALQRLIHYDVYRLLSYDEIIDMGFEEQVSDGVTFVEWGDKFPELKTLATLQVMIQHCGDGTRQIMMITEDARAGKVASELAGKLRISHN